MIPIYFIIFFLASAKALIGYDCGSERLNVTTVSLVDVGECETPKNQVNVTKRYIQLLQLNEYTEVEVIQCKIEITRILFECASFSHLSPMRKNFAQYISEISAEACRGAHNTGTLNFNDKLNIIGLQNNHTKSVSVDLGGGVHQDRTCNGGEFTDPYGSWSSVIVEGSVKISLANHIARADLDHDKIYLNSGTSCRFSDGACMDNVGGNTFWRPIPGDNCKFDRYSVLYEGYANKMIDTSSENPQTVYSVTTDDVTFALGTKGRVNLCGYMILKTEHPKLLIFETIRGEYFTSRKSVGVSNLDIFAYVNSKFVYVEKHLRSQMQQLYRDVVLQRCKLERETLKNSLAIATQSPDEFAYNLMKGPGYMAVLAGEVVHVIKCIPVEVKVEHGENCYNELQVARENQTYFMTPRTHILKTKGTQINCNPLLPSQFAIGSTWYKIMPRPMSTSPPIIIKPLSEPTWEYVSPSNLATSGIYTNEDLSKLREHIMFPVERQSLLNDVAREMDGQVIANHHGTLIKLLNDEVVDKIAFSAWNKAWSKFMVFGTASAGMIGIFMIIHIIKMLVDIIIRGYTLHTIFGWSLHLLGALWGSIAHCLISMSNANQPTDTEEIKSKTMITPEATETIPLSEVTTEAPKAAQRNDTAKSTFFNLNS